MLLHITALTLTPPRSQHTVSDLPSAVKSGSEVLLNVFVPLDALRQAVEENCGMTRMGIRECGRIA